MMLTVKLSAYRCICHPVWNPTPVTTTFYLSSNIIGNSIKEHEAARPCRMNAAVMAGWYSSVPTLYEYTHALHDFFLSLPKAETQNLVFPRRLPLLPSHLRSSVVAISCVCTPKKKIIMNQTHLRRELEEDNSNSATPRNGYQGS